MPRRAAGRTRRRSSDLPGEGQSRDRTASSPIIPGQSPASSRLRASRAGTCGLGRWRSGAPRCAGACHRDCLIWSLAGRRKALIFVPCKRQRAMASWRCCARPPFLPHSWPCRRPTPICRTRIRSFAKFTTFKLLTPNDKLAVYGIDDPIVQRNCLSLPVPEKGGLSGALGLAEQTSDISLACRQYGPIKFKKSSHKAMWCSARSDRFSSRRCRSSGAAKKNILVIYDL